MIFDPMHFLPLLEQKVGALDQAAPLQGWDLLDSHTKCDTGYVRDRHGNTVQPPHA